MKKIFIGVTLFSMVLVAGGKTAFAVDTTSTGDVSLTASETATPPVKPGLPEDGTETGMTGSLTVDYVPNFSFTQAEGGLSGTFSDATEKNVQVSDKRGTGEGWDLVLSISPFSDTDKVIKGSAITLPGTAEKGSINNTSADITAKNNSGVLVNSAAPTQLSIATAAKDEGLGTWLVKFQNASMEIPEGNAAGNYSSTFTWTLTSTPVE